MSYRAQPFVGNRNKPEDLLLWLHQELIRIENAFTSPELGHARFKVWHVEPTRIFEGLVVMADGTDWDPGAGAGLYRYSSSAWVRIG